MSNHKIINEVFLLRSMSCLSIVLLHSINRIYIEENSMLSLFTLLLTFGTPAFVFISELVISHSYPTETPRRFWSKRVRYILLPYVFFGLFYAFSKALEGWLFKGASFFSSLFNYSWKHLLLGDFQGYFILIIFQFYLLHLVFQKYLAQYSPKMILGTSLLINIIYLGLFNFTTSPDGPVLQYIWQQGYWLPFLGWIFYFTVAYYCGLHYQKFIQALMKWKKYIFVLTVLGAMIPMVLTSQELLTVHSSKRIDMLFFTIMLTFSLYIVAHQMKKVPQIWVRISQYSFGIYLLHPFYMGVMIIAVSRIPILSQSILGVLVLFVASILCSILTTYLLNQIKWGPYVIGKIGIGVQTNPPGQVASSQRTAQNV